MYKLLVIKYRRQLCKGCVDFKGQVLHRVSNFWSGHKQGRENAVFGLKGKAGRDFRPFSCPST